MKTNKDDIENKLDKFAIYVNTLRLKQLLIYLKDNNINICNLISDDIDQFKDIIKSINNLIVTEPSFFLLDDSFINNSFEMLNIHRFNKEFIKDKENFELVNESISYLNHINALSTEDKISDLNNYLEQQYYLRQGIFLSIDALLSSISYDSFALDQILGNDKSHKDNVFLLFSVNYLLETFPQLFKNKIIRNNTYSLLSEIPKEKGFRNRTKNKCIEATKNKVKKLGE